MTAFVRLCGRSPHGYGTSGAGPIQEGGATASYQKRGEFLATILIVDDEPDILMLLTTTFRLAGHEVLEASDGIAALQLLESRRPDLVVTDLRMPRMDGSALISRLRGNLATARIPIIVVSGSPVGGLDADSVHAKPFRADDLVDAADRLLRRGA